MDMIRQMLDEAMYKYLAVLLAQPFDVAKTILQVKSQGAIASETQENAKKTKKGMSDFMESRYADVCAGSAIIDAAQANYCDSTHPTTLIQMNQLTLHRQTQQAHLIPQIAPSAMLPTVQAMSCQNQEMHQAHTSSL